MSKPGITIEIPGLGRRQIRTVLTDYTGTHSFDGKLVAGIKPRLRKLAKFVDIYVITSDTFGTAERELKTLGPSVRMHRLKENSRGDREKLSFGRKHDLRHVAAFGNGNNDRLLLKAVKKAGGLAIAVDNGEGCSIDAIVDADVFIAGAAHALDLLLNPKRLKATLRF